MTQVPKHLLMPRDQSAGKNQNMKIDSALPKNVAKFSSDDNKQKLDS
jgi:hypothetical protein